MKEYKSKLIGKRADIIDKESNWYGHWGFIKMYGGDVYHVDDGSISLDGSPDVTPIFDRDQFIVRREKKDASRR